MTNIFSRFVKDESGATAIEYGLIAAIVGVGIIVGLQNLEQGLTGVFNKIQGDLNAESGAGG